MLTARFAAAFWLIYATFAFRPTFTKPQMLRTLEAMPELGLAALTFGMLPAVVGAACVFRWLRRDLAPVNGAFAVATRCAALLAMVGMLLPLHAADAASVSPELAYRAGQLIALLLVLDGGLQPKE